MESQASLIRGRWNCSQRGVRLETAVLLAFKVEERLGAKECKAASRFWKKGKETDAPPGHVGWGRRGRGHSPANSLDLTPVKPVPNFALPEL